MIHRKNNTNWHAMDVESVGQMLKSSVSGLNAQQILKRLEQHGYNIIESAKVKSNWAILISQLKSPVVYLLIVAAAVSFAFGDITESIAIMIVVFINTAIGFIMEKQAVYSMQALKQFDKVVTKIIRNDVLQEIDALELVPGDLLYVEAGDMIPADARIIESKQLQVNESALTGESLPVPKDTKTLTDETILAERANMLYKGTAVSRGNAKAYVVGTGMNTEIGRISNLVHEAEKEKIPLNEKLEVFSKKLIWLIVLIIIPFALLGYFEERDLYLMIETAIALAVAAIPEGLPIVATIALAKGMLKLAKHKVIVKKLAAVETLGETNVIFTDKTGTLTENKLEVDTIQVPDQKYGVKWEHKNHRLKLIEQTKIGTESNNINKLFEVAVLCNNASYLEESSFAGDPLEVALLRFSGYFKKDFSDSILKTSERINEQPFDSDTKVMGVLVKRGSGYMVAVKGATEELIKICSHFLHHNNRMELSDEQRNIWLNSTNEIAAKGLKVLAFAYSEYEKPIKNWMSGLTFIGLVGFLDPPREDVPLAIKACKHAGIKVIMVTGDHPATSQNISNRIGLIDDIHDPVIHGSELKDFDQLTMLEIKELERSRIFSRVTPHQKLELVGFYKDKGDIVAMTGDGVNDAPALKKSDIGIAMGIRGTQVAREAADMVLQDDAFPSIVRAVQQGRIIFKNIKNFIIYLLSCNLSEIMVVAVAAFANLALPLLPLQILFLNIVTDVFPALALGMGKGNPSVMTEPPRNPTSPLLSTKNWTSIIVYAMILTISVLGVFLYGLYFKNYSSEVCNNLAFLSLAFAQLVHPLNLISAKENLINNDIVRNPHLWAAVVFCIILIQAVYFIPYTSQVLSLQILDLSSWILISSAAIVPVIVIQVLKRLYIIE